jgi:catechol 2,3-dioxygenase-like lactoylglutathione lyase family enzyme
MDLTRTHWWYRHALGFLAAGERRQREGPAYAAVPGLPEVALDVWCLVGSQPFVQVEMIEFALPRMRARASTWQRSDIGYSTVGIHVPDFDAAMARVHRVGGQFLTDPLGPRGERCVCLLDPDDTLLELIEAAPWRSRESTADQADLPAIASASLSVRDLERSRRFWIDVLGCAPLAADAVHRSEHEALWGLGGAARETAAILAGNVAIELVQYDRPQSRGRRAGYLLSDQGILNVALGCTDKDEFDEVYARAVARGFRGYTEPWTLPDVATVVYLTDEQGFSVELLHVEPTALARMGFVADEPNETDASNSLASAADGPSVRVPA